MFIYILNMRSEGRGSKLQCLIVSVKRFDLPAPVGPMVIITYGLDMYSILLFYL